MMTLSPTTAGLLADLPEPGNSMDWAVWGIIVGVGSVLLLCCSCCVFYKCCRRPAKEQRLGYGVDFRQLQALNNLDPNPRAGIASCRTHRAVGNTGLHFLVQHGHHMPTLRARETIQARMDVRARLSDSPPASWALALALSTSPCFDEDRSTEDWQNAPSGPRT